ncbi:ABC transporter permease [Streptomyces sp. NPDC051561]|uniref:ABC transporter permease n=1 Tax=Streptomyces sp. NPDC051561 TaxID=3365658 RepID=UPI0037ADE7EF
MSAPTAPKEQQGARSGDPAGRLLRRLGRVQVTQHRKALWTSAVVVVLTVAVAGGLRGWREVSGGTLDGIFRGPALLGQLTTLVGASLTLLPLAIGAFVAGPMIARELESGTYKIAWTQSVSPARWLTATLAVVLAGTVVALPLLMLAFGLMRGAFTGADRPYAKFFWHNTTVYQSLGPVALGYALLGLAAGALIGLLVRRTLVSAVVTVGAVGAVMLVMQWLREGLWPTRTRLGDGAAETAEGYQPELWGHGGGWQTAAGVRVDTEACYAVSAGDGKRESNPDAWTSAFDRCVADRGGVTQYFDYHSEADFLPLQLVETAILLGLAALLTLAAYRALRRLHG